MQASNWVRLPSWREDWYSGVDRLRVLSRELGKWRTTSERTSLQIQSRCTTGMLACVQLCSITRRTHIKNYFPSQCTWICCFIALVPVRTFCIWHDIFRQGWVRLGMYCCARSHFLHGLRVGSQNSREDVQIRGEWCCWLGHQRVGLQVILSCFFLGPLTQKQESSRSSFVGAWRSMQSCMLNIIRVFFSGTGLEDQRDTRQKSQHNSEILTMQFKHLMCQSGCLNFAWKSVDSPSQTPDQMDWPLVRPLPTMTQINQPVNSPSFQLTVLKLCWLNWANCACTWHLDAHTFHAESFQQQAIFGSFENCFLFVSFVSFFRMFWPQYYKLWKE